MNLLCVVPFQQSIFCGGDFAYTIALDLQQKLKPFHYFSHDQTAMRFFRAIYSSFMYFRNSPRSISVISNVFWRLNFSDIAYTFSCGTVLLPSNLSS